MHLQLNSIHEYLEKVLEYFDRNCTHVEGLFDTKGNDFNISKIIRNIKIRQNFSQFIKELETEHSPHDIAWSLVEILKSLPDCLFTSKLYHLWVVFNLNEEQRIEKFKQCILQLPENNVKIMNLLFKVFVKISIDNSTKTNVTPVYIGEIFGTSLIRIKWKNQMDELANIYNAPIITSTFITHYHILFTDIDQEFQIRQQISQEKANEFMNYVLEKYLSFEKHFQDLYLDILNKKKWNPEKDKDLIIETIKMELNPFLKKKERKKVIGFFDNNNSNNNNNNNNITI